MEIPSTNNIFNLKLSISEYFDQIINEIDTIAEILLETYHHESSKNFDQDILSAKVNTDRKVLIDQINTVRIDVFDKIEKNINSFIHDQEKTNQNIASNNDFLSKIVTKYCFYLKKEDLINYHNEQMVFGILVILDLFMTSEEIDLFK